MILGYYNIYQFSSGEEKWIATFRDVENVRLYIEANRPNLDEINYLEIDGEYPNEYVETEGRKYIKYIPYSPEMKKYYIRTKGSHGLVVKYVTFDD